jgi:hypothetical protein
VTRLRARRSGARIPAGASDFSLFQNVQTIYGAHPKSYSMATAVLSREQSDRGMNMTTRLYLVLRLISGATPLLPLDVFRAWTWTNLSFFIPLWRRFLHEYFASSGPTLITRTGAQCNIKARRTRGF